MANNDMWNDYNNDMWNNYMQNRAAGQNQENTTIDPSSPPYDNLNVTDGEPIISLRPTQQSQNNAPVIPGPGQVVQRGLFRKRAHNAMVQRGETSQARSTQDFVREAINEAPQADPDFSSSRWTSTIDYIIREGSLNRRTSPFWIQLAEIRCPRTQFVKVKKIVAMVSSFTPNRLGGMLVTLKDPSGKIDGTMHRNIFNNDEYRLTIGVGAVLILKNVTVARFDMKPKYMNITVRNIVKIIGANSMVAEYQPVDVTPMEEEDGGNTGYEDEIVPDSDEE